MNPSASEGVLGPTATGSATASWAAPASRNQVRATVQEYSRNLSDQFTQPTCSNHATSSWQAVASARGATRGRGATVRARRGSTAWAAGRRARPAPPATAPATS